MKMQPNKSDPDASIKALRRAAFPLKLSAWTLQIGVWQNLIAESGLRLRRRGSQRIEQSIAKNARGPAMALIEFAYADLPVTGPVPMTVLRMVNMIHSFRPRGLHMPGMESHADDQPLSLADLRRVQLLVRQAFAELLLSYPPDQAELSASRIWRAPQFAARIRYLRAGPWLLYDLDPVSPHWMKLLFACGNIMEDAFAWLRFCELCGRLFFKVKRQRFCTQGRCKDVFRMRKKLRKEWKCEESERRGRPRKDKAGAIEAIHTAWIGLSKEELSRTQGRKGNRRG